ncbi:MAG: leucine--tRNA ligase [Chloroflexota bacterium]|nr:leucine--tRNA ligase [Dehalococcoidia bacterium]MDW8253382.1 leucine--tRNA ligase [Chloroflexota bacterium]
MTERRVAIPPYKPAEIEPKWQARWEADGLYRAPDYVEPKWYYLTMFPYTSGDLHMGHWYAMAPTDVQARWRRMKGYNVMLPIGFDAFGLPAENAAIKRGIHPAAWTMANIENMRRQLKTIGASFDWSREVITCLPEYYKWNQWFFLRMLERGLAYRAKAQVNWCPDCQTVLANEQVTPAGLCERSDTPVYKRELEQWFLRITAYAEELLNHEGLDWPERVKQMQKNWIGRSEGVEVSFGIEGREGEIRVFTTRPDTIFGVTFMVLAPEHPLVEELTTPEQREEVEAYIAQTRRLSEIERQSTEREKTGVRLGSYAINRLNGQRVPIFIADYVLATYGTGAVMGVPAHDERDFEFARKYGLPIPVVIAPPGWDGAPLEAAYVGEGTMVNSGQFDGLPSAEGWQRIADYIEANGWGGRRVTYRMRDWLISRQRYWGTPIPVVYCDRDGIVPVPDDQLPVTLPEQAEFRPTGQSPLTYTPEFLHTTCPKCGGPARRETDTMDTFVDSSWYWFRYLSPHETTRPFDPALAKFWTPVDQYTGGAEHATMHLLYARFFTMVLRDLGLIDHGEPFRRLFNQGQILAQGRRMSKSRGNVVTPDDYVRRNGADSMRLFLMFIGPWDQGGDWNDRGIGGISRWLNRVWNLVLTEAPPREADPAAERALRRLIHRTIKKVDEDIAAFRFNTMVATLMTFTNELADRQAELAGTAAWREAIETLLLLLAPSAPHLTEELWERLGKPYSIHQQPFPSYDPELAREEEVEIPVQVNGKVRDKLTVPVGADEETVRKLALASERVQRHLDGKPPSKVIYVPNRLINIVIR